MRRTLIAAKRCRSGTASPQGYRTLRGRVAALCLGAALMPCLASASSVNALTGSTDASALVASTTTNNNGNGVAKASPDKGVTPPKDAHSTIKVSNTPGRIITLAPHVTEMVFAAGAGDKVIATVSSSNYPPEARDIPRMGDGLSINAEQMLILEPDLLVGWQNTLALQKLMPLLTKLGIAVMYSEPHVLDDIPDSIEQLGQALGTPEQASAKADTLRQQLKTLRDTYAHRTPVSVFIEVGTGPLYTLGDDALTNDAIATCGGVNVFHDSALVAPAVTIESVLARDPDVIIVAHAAAGHVAQRASYWKGLHGSAAQNNHVYGIHPDKLVRPGPRLIQATQQLCDYLDRVRH